MTKVSVNALYCNNPSQIKAPERLGSGRPNPDAKWVYQTLKGAKKNKSRAALVPGYGRAEAESLMEGLYFVP
jgi:hypothetical protein